MEVILYVIILSNSFKDWSKLLALKYEEKIGDVEGEFDNA